MRTLGRFLLMLLLILGTWIGIGVGIGMVLHRLVPAIDVGIGTLIGVVTLGLSFQWLSQVSTLSALSEEDTAVPEAPWPTMPPLAPRASRRQHRRRHA
jgi:hypothetical protein